MKRRLGQIIGRNVPATGGFPAAFSAWSVRHEITIPQTSSMLTDFPVYVDLSDLSATFWSAIESAAVATVQGSSIGGDIRVTQSDGETEVPIEPVSVDGAADSGELHFKATTSDVGSTTYYIYGGNSGATAYAKNATNGAEAVWNASFALVSHNGGVEDSSSNANNGTPNAVTSVTGNMGSASEFNGTNSLIAVPHDSSLNFASALTISALINPDTYGSPVASGFYGRIARKGTNFDVRIQDITSEPSRRDQIVYLGTEVSDAITLNTWQWVAVTDNGSTFKIFVNGVVVDTGSSSGFTTNTDSLAIGNFDTTGAIGRYFDGTIDELRFSSSALSNDWLAEEHANQSDTSSWYTIGAVETN